MNIVRAESVEKLSALATKIVKEYYDPLLGSEQNDYMVAKFQSVEGIQKQIESGYQYYFLVEEKEVGFVGFFKRGDELYLSKFYIDAPYRGRGYGRQALAFLKGEAEKMGVRKITLNVNKYNPTTKIYEAFGMIRVRAEVIDIGNGFVMDDFVYSLVW